MKSIKEFVNACNCVKTKNQDEQRIIGFAKIALKTQSEIKKFLGETEQAKEFRLPDGFYYSIEKHNGVYIFGSAGFDTVFKSKKSMLDWIDDDLKELLLATINEIYRKTA